MGDWINTIVQGVMVGGLYAMFAIGLAMIFGVMKLVNIAHGDLIVLSAYVALIVAQAFWATLKGPQYAGRAGDDLNAEPRRPLIFSSRRSVHFQVSPKSRAARQT